jgi:hypothetical protein
MICCTQILLSRDFFPALPYVSTEEYFSLHCSRYLMFGGDPSAARDTFALWGPLTMTPASASMGGADVRSSVPSPRRLCWLPSLGQKFYPRCLRAQSDAGVCRGTLVCWQLSSEKGWPCSHHPSFPRDRKEGPAEKLLRTRPCELGLGPLKPSVSMSLLSPFCLHLKSFNPCLRLEHTLQLATLENPRALCQPHGWLRLACISTDTAAPLTF